MLAIPSCVRLSDAHLSLFYSMQGTQKSSGWWQALKCAQNMKKEWTRPGASSRVFHVSLRHAKSPCPNGFMISPSSLSLIIFVLSLHIYWLRGSLPVDGLNMMCQKLYHWSYGSQCWLHICWKGLSLVSLHLHL